MKPPIRLVSIQLFIVGHSCTVPTSKRKFSLGAAENRIAINRCVNALVDLSNSGLIKLKTSSKGVLAVDDTVGIAEGVSGVVAVSDNEEVAVGLTVVTEWSRKVPDAYPVSALINRTSHSPFNPCHILAAPQRLASSQARQLRQGIALVVAVAGGLGVQYRVKKIVLDKGERVLVQLIRSVVTPGATAEPYCTNSFPVLRTRCSPFLCLLIIQIWFPFLRTWSQDL